MAHVTIPDEAPRLQFDVGGTPQSIFNFDFSYFAAADVFVVKELKSGGGPVALTQGVDYTLLGYSVDGGYEGGTVTLTSAATDAYITIYRELAVERLTDFPSGPFSISALNSELDRIVALIQQISGDLDRTFRFDITSTELLDALSFPPSERANKVLGFDEDGELQMLPSAGTWRGTWTGPGTTYEVRDIVIDPVTGNYYYNQNLHVSQATLAADADKWDLFLDISDFGKIQDSDGDTYWTAKLGTNELRAYVAGVLMGTVGSTGWNLNGKAVFNYGEKVSTGNVTGTQNLDLSASNTFFYSLNGDTYFTVSAPIGVASGGTLILAKNGYNCTFSASFLFPGGTQPAQAQQGYEVYSFISPNGSSFFCSMAGTAFA